MINNKKRWPAQLFVSLLQSGRTTNWEKFYLQKQHLFRRQQEQDQVSGQLLGGHHTYQLLEIPSLLSHPQEPEHFNKPTCLQYFWYPSIIGSNHNQQQPEFISQTDWKSTTSLHCNCMRKEPYLLPWALWKQNRRCRDELARSHCFGVLVCAHHCWRLHSFKSHILDQEDCHSATQSSKDRQKLKDTQCTHRKTSRKTYHTIADNDEQLKILSFKMQKFLYGAYCFNKVFIQPLNWARSIKIPNERQHTQRKFSSKHHMIAVHYGEHLAIM